MKLKIEHVLMTGIVACLATGTTLLIGNSYDAYGKTIAEQTEDTMLTKEVFAGSASFMRGNIETNEYLKNMVSDVTITAGSGTALTMAMENVVNVQAAPVEEVTAEAAQPQNSEWSNKVMAKVEDSANIRVNADSDSELVGRLPQGASAEIIERGNEWTKISSGKVTGFVKNDYLAFDDEAKQIADSIGKKATVTTETLRVRREANGEAEVVDLASAGDTFKVVSEEADWIAVEKDGTTGFVAAEFVAVDYNLISAKSIEEERAEERAKEEAEKKAIAKARAAEEKAAKKASKNVKVDTTQREALMAEADDVTLLAALIQVEAGGQSYECQLAVGSVIVNRVNSSRFPNSISGVIYQSGQFPGAHNGKVARVLANGVKSSCLSAANEALSGTNNIGSYLFFNTDRAVSKSRLNDYTVIDGECFY